jgi:hypothetical protein
MERDTGDAGCGGLNLGEGDEVGHAGFIVRQRRLWSKFGFGENNNNGKTNGKESNAQDGERSAGTNWRTGYGKWAGVNVSIKRCYSHA